MQALFFLTLLDDVGCSNSNLTVKVKTKIHTSNWHQKTLDAGGAPPRRVFSESHHRSIELKKLERLILSYLVLNSAEREREREREREASREEVDCALASISHTTVSIHSTHEFAVLCTSESAGILV